MPNANKPLSPRLRTILELVVRDYIITAEPVGSEGLVKRHGLSLSSATVRKVMAELEEMGLLAQPHTSAGRTPTEAGLKTYVGEILAVDRLSNEMRSLIDRQLAGGQPKAGQVLSLCSRVLSNITRHMGVVAAPAVERLALKQLYFVRLGVREVLALMVGENGLMRNKVLAASEDFSQDELNQVNSYLTEICQSGLTLDEIRGKILEAMGEEKRAFDALYKRALELSSRALEAEEAEGDDCSCTEDPPLYFEGQGNLLQNPEFAETEAMRALFRAFEDKRRILGLLNEVADSGQVRIVIGREAAAAALSGLALVASPYSGGDRNMGALGIIGPQRLNYSQVVPVVDYAARVVSELLDSD
ncbi:heat-inducible transcriptional repressor HrcA [Deltaproteobacteria bacterium OttesenSCG-928-M10]|nr:heat-inducible transcriptional repressor HrcA [Deltaproteobacteria bacterium OttesenSCG-928-M10]